MKKSGYIYTFYIILVLVIMACIISCFICQKETIAIIGAMDVEINQVAANLSNKKYKQQSDFKIITGNIGKHKVVLSESGIGKVNARTFNNKWGISEKKIEEWI